MNQGGQDERIRRRAAAWFARLRGPSAERHRAAFERWLARDARHRAAFERLERLWSRSAELAPQPADAPAARRARPHRRATLVGGGALAAAAAAAAIVRVAGGEELASPVGVRRQVALGDGARLVLDADSAVLRSRDHEDPLRLLRGRARFIFSEAPGAHAVRAAGAEVVCGPAVFDLDLEDGQVGVLVLDGAVAIRRAGREGGPQTGPSPGRPRVSGVPLAPRQLARWTDGQVVRQAAAGSAAAWTQGVLAYDAAPLELVVAQVNRYSRRKIRLQGRGLAALQVSGVFKADDPVQTAASLAESFNLSLTRGDHDWVLSRA